MGWKSQATELFETSPFCSWVKIFNKIKKPTDNHIQTKAQTLSYRKVLLQPR